MKKRGFTLIELLIVISIIAVIIGLTSANFLGARSRARDAKTKAEMKELKNALRMYYNDHQSYPKTATVPNTVFSTGCGVDGGEPCPNTAPCPEFAAWPAGGDCSDDNLIVYMKRLPRTADGSAYSFTYKQGPLGEDFCLTAPFENRADSELEVSQNRCGSVCNSIDPNLCMVDSKNYCMCAD